MDGKWERRRVYGLNSTMSKSFTNMKRWAARIRGRVSTSNLRTKSKRTQLFLFMGGDSLPPTPRTSLKRCLNAFGGADSKDVSRPSDGIRIITQRIMDGSHSLVRPLTLTFRNIMTVS